MTSLQKVFVKFWPIFNLLGFKIYSYKNLINNVDFMLVFQAMKRCPTL